MTDRWLPVHPSLRQLKNQAKELLRSIRRGDPAALADLEAHHPKRPASGDATLVDAQLVLARSYGVSSWPRLLLACEVTDAICHDRVDDLRDLMLKHPSLLSENARGTATCNWGPPMSYAANLGRMRIIDMLRGLGASDLTHAFDRACLQGEIATARQLLAMGARPPRDAFVGPAETLNPGAMRFLLELGVEISDASGDPLGPIGMVLDGYGRNPDGKHECLELLAKHVGVTLPDTPTMAVHRGRIDLLESHVKRDPHLLSRTFSLTEIYPPELKCHPEALHATPLAGATLLHMAVDYDEMEIARWLLDRGMDVNARAEVDAEGFGGHTALFGCVVAQSIRMRESDDFAELLLGHGADPNVRVSLRKRLLGVGDELMHEFRGVTPLSWGERFHERSFVSERSMRLIARHGGKP
jgi:ankyrin repeat protein